MREGSLRHGRGPSSPAPRRIGITGTPGTGKRTLASLLSQALGLEHINIGEVARDLGGQGLAEDEVEVEPRRLWSHIKRILPSGFVISGHLLPSVIPGRVLDMVIVLRCHPLELKRRLEARGYPPSKVKDNVVAEAIDLVFAEAAERYGLGKIVEFDTTGKNPQVLLAEVLDVLREPRKPRRRLVDWLSTLQAEGRLDLLL